MKFHDEEGLEDQFAENTQKYAFLGKPWFTLKNGGSR